MNHLNQKMVVWLGVAAVVAIIAAVALTATRKPLNEDSAQQVQYALPELREHVNDVSALSLTGAGNALLVSLKRESDGWHVLDKGGYRADAAKLREFLLKLTDASLVEAKTSSEARYAELGVSDVKPADAKGVLVALDGLSKPLQLIVGNPNTRSSGTYVRRAGEAQSWLAKGALTPDKSAAAWLDKSLLDIPATRIKEVALTRADGKSLRVSKASEGDANFSVAAIPKGRALSSEFVANGLASTLAGLNLEDVFPAGSAAPPEGAKVNKAHYATFDGISVDVVAWKKDDKDLARLSVSLDESAADASISLAQAKARSEWEASQQAEAGKPAEAAQAASAAKPAPVAPLAVSDAAKDRSQRLDAIKAEASALKARFDGWTFVLPSHKFGNMDKSIDDLLQPLSTAKPDEKKPALPKPAFGGAH